MCRPSKYQANARREKHPPICELLFAMCKALLPAAHLTLLSGFEGLFLVLENSAGGQFFGYLACSRAFICLQRCDLHARIPR